MGFSLKKLGSRIFDQVNMFDNNRTYQQRTPTQTKSVFQQAGQAGGQFARGSVGGIAKVANTYALQAPQVVDTIRQQVAARTNNPSAFRAATERLKATEAKFNRNVGGFLNQGTIWNQDEVQRGDFKTGLRAYPVVAQAVVEGYTLGTGAPVGASIKELGLKQGLKAVTPALSKTFGGNIAQGGITAYNQGAKGKDILKSAALSGALGTVGDVGLGVVGAAARPILSDAVGKVYGATKANKVPGVAPLKPNQVIRDPAKLNAVNELRYQLTRPDNVNPSAINTNNAALRQIMQDHNIDLVTGTPADRLQRATQFLEQNGEAIQNGTGLGKPKVTLRDRLTMNEIGAVGKNVRQQDPDVTARLWKDYVESKPAIKGDALTGEGVLPPAPALSESAKASLMAKAKAKVGVKSLDEAGGGAVGDSEVLAAIRKLQGREQPKLPNGTGLEDVKVKSGLGTQLETAFVEKDQPIIGVLRQIEKKSGKKGLVDQFMYDSGLVSRSDSIANAKLSSNPNLKGALEGLSKKKLGEFNDYSSARSELYNATRGLPTTRPVEELQAIVNQLGGENAARFDSLNRFYKDYAKDLYDGGIISREKFDQFVSSPDYVRTQRDMADLIGFKSGSGGGYSLKSTLTNQKRVGSSKREILPADRTAFDYAQKTQAEIQRNQAATNLIDMLQGTDLIRKIKEGEKVGNKNTVARFVDGVQEQFEVTPEIKQAVDHLAPYQLGLLQKIVSAPKRIFQAGTTGLSAPFTVANYVKDQLGSGINSKNIIATHNPINIFRGLKEASQDFFGARNSDAWERFLAHSGDTTQFDLLRGEKNAAQLSRELRMGGVGKTINRVLSPIKTLEDAVSITEKATRYQNFLGMEKTALKEGATKPQALKAGTLAAWQNSTDFNRYGDWSKTLNLLIPYFNSGVQGTRQLTRSFKTRPVATTIKTMATVGMPLLASTAYNLSDPDRKKIYDNISEFEKENNFILIPPGSKQNKDGTYDVYKLPMPFGYSNLMGPARRAMVSFANKSPQDWAKVATDIMGAFSGPVNTNSPQQAVAGLIPQAVKPLVQQAANKDFFTGKDIVPEYVNKATDAQGNPIPESKKALSYTSGSAQIIGNLSGQSPIRVEKFFKDTFGRIGQYGTNTADNVLAKLGVIDEKQIGGVSAKDDIIRRFTKAQGNYNYEKSAGGKYYDNVKEATKGLDANEQAAYSTLHPSKTNFLGEDIFDENKRLTKYARAGIYLQFPDVFEADRRLNEAQAKQGAPSNPLYELPPAQLTRVLLKATLPPGSKDPELSNLYQQEWYQDYNTKRSQYYEQIKSKMAKEGKSLPPSDNPYPETPKALQKTMDTYSSLPKGTGARSAWIKANPQAFEAMKNQWSAVDAWENKERVALGLSPIENTDTSKQYGNSGYGSGGGRTATSYAGKSKVSVKGTVAKPKISTKSPGKLQGSVKYAASSKPKVSIKKSLV